MTTWNRFWKWYKSKLRENLIFLLIIHILQIPHFIWAGDCFMALDLVCNQHGPVIDFLLYGIDLVELLSLATIISNIYAHGWYGKSRKD